MSKLEQLLEAYGFTEDELDFEHEGLSDEELELAFEDYAKRKKKCSEEDGEPIATEEEACKKKKKCSDEDEEPVATEEEACGAKKKKKCSNDNGEGSEDDDDKPVATEEEAACGGKKKKRKCSSDETFVLKYELSHEDVRTALYNLLYEYSDDEYCTAWIINVYDNKFVYQDCADNRYYRQGYSKDGDVVSLNDDKTEVFNEWLSKEEKDALKALKENYAELKAFKDNYDAAELKAQKEAVLAAEEYSVLAEDEAFKALVANMDQYSVEELKVKADLAFAAHMKSTMEFSAKTDDGAKKPKVLGFNFNDDKKKKVGPYGNLFADK